MKNIKLFATALMVAMCAMVVTSCSNDDDDNGSDLSTIIVGTWKITAWESNEGKPNEGVGTQFTFKKDGFMDLGTAKDVAKWSVLKKGTTYEDEMYRSTVLKYDALLLMFLTAEDNGDETVFLVKEYTANTAQVSILEFELGGGYSRGTITKVK